MTFLKSNWILITVLFSILFLTTCTLTYAYYVNQESRGIVLVSGSFEVSVLAYFDEDEITVESPYYEVENQVIVVNAFDETSQNYIGKLKISIEIIPRITARMRIQLQDEWLLTRTFLDENGLPTVPVVESVYHTPKGEGYYPFSLLKTDSSFLPIYASDSYAYIDEVLNKNTLYRYDVIIGGDPYPVRSNYYYTETCMVRLGLIIDVIQANRFQELWGLEETFYN
ncbi:MAG: hypothetical protein A2084_03510 [Tenericutes bacterium GWC2_39_45]|nr:MAG: hypothetical protein A2Y43_00615 [Tenericutes bacterium GWA2_38_26]OHE30510.1 MAG: hypothetical protein A2084_03510 [Tenericutes bacterium GWC2_39_45]OHE32637.1 MAG: hypothetical protein A2009_05970 [Tenericutes bacterium GWD2_38_27]OHE39373.1 MAG: hypothetical protein A2013_01230 [Tenericutes bacterium GWE2_38_8]HBG33315.1 hypothetical protein [Acholeplasmataceae bacterium]